MLLQFLYSVGISTRNGLFEKRTNFCLDIVCAISTPPHADVPLHGFVYLIRTTNGVDVLLASMGRWKKVAIAPRHLHRHYSTRQL